MSEQVTQAVGVVPQSLEAERSVLACLMLNKDSWDLVADKIRKSDFYFPEHRDIYQAINDLIVKDHAPDLVTVKNQLESLELLQNIGGYDYLCQLVKSVPSSSNVSAYADIVRDRSVRRKLIETSEKVIRRAQEHVGSYSEILDHAEQDIFAINSAAVDQSDGVRELSTVLASAVDNLQKLYESKSDITGLKTKFRSLDYLTSGLQKSDLIIVAGRPSMGKTMFSLNLAEYSLVKEDQVVLFFSLEMPAESIANRLLSSIGGIHMQALRTGKLQDPDWPNLTSAISMLSGKKFLIDDSGTLSPTELRAKARRVKKQYKGLDLIIVDYLQLMKVNSKYDSRVLEISEISRSLKSLARELDCPVVALSQLNRGLEQRTDKRPMMADLRDSGALEQDADVIFFIYRDEVYNDDTNDKGIAEIIISKQRNGPTGTVKLSCKPEVGRFFDLEKNDDLVNILKKDNKNEYIPEKES